MKDYLSFEAVKDICREAYNRSGGISIKSYLNSDGLLADYLVSILPDGGYKALVKKSLEMVQSGQVTKPEHLFGLEAWHTGINEKVESWEATLRGESRTKGYTNRLVRQGDDGFWQDPKLDFEHVILKGLYVHSQSVILSGDPKKESEKSQVKRYIEANVPVGKYLSQMNLYPDKFDHLYLRVDVDMNAILR